VAEERPPATDKPAVINDKSRSLSLAREALSYIDKRLDLALLLAVAANEAADTPEGRGALLSALQSWPQLIRYIHGGGGWVENVAFGGGGSLSLRGRKSGGTIEFWDTASGRPDGTPIRLDKNIMAMAVSPDGNTVALITEDHLHLYDYRTRRPVRPPSEFEGWVDDLVFGPGGVLVGETGWGELRLWDALTGAPIGGPVQAHEHMIPMDAGGVFVSSSPNGPWSPSSAGMPEECTVTCFAVIGKSIFAGSNNGVFRSKDNGANWQAVNSGLTSRNIGCLAVKGRDLFAGGYGGVFRSQDEGASWKPTGPGLAQADVRALLTSGPNLFAGTDRGVFLSADNGASWASSSSGLTDPDVKCLAVLGPYLFAGTDGGGIFRSKDDGAGWTAVNSGLKDKDISTFAVMGPNLYAGTYGGGVFLSTDNGAAWTEVNSGLLNKWVQALVVVESRLFAGTKGGVFVSSTHGARWTSFDAGLPGYATVSSLAASGGVLLAGTEGGGSSQSNNIMGLVFSPDGKTVVSGAADGTIRRSTATGLASCGPPVMAHGGGVASLAFHPDGTILASGSEDGAIRLWHWPSMEPAGEEISPHGGAVRLAYAPDGVLLSMANAAKICRWDGKTLEEIGKPIPTGQDRPRSLAVRSDGLVATGAADGTVMLWDLECENRLLTPVPAHGDHGASFVGADELVAAGGNGVLRYWSALDGRLLRESFTAGGKSITEVAVSSTGRVAVGLDNGVIQLSDPETGDLGPPVNMLNGMVSGLRFNAAGDRLVACDFIPGSLCILDLRSGVPAGPSRDAELGNLGDIALSPDEKVVAAVGENGLRLFDARDLHALTEPLDVPGGIMFCLAFTPDGKIAVTGGDASTSECVIRFRDGTTGKLAGPEIKTPPVHDLLLIQGGKILAGGGYNGEVRLWDVRTHRPCGVLTGLEKWVVRYLVAGPGETLVAAFDSGDVEIWDVDPASWMAKARRIANRELTAEEKARFLQLPAGGGVR
jgi:WD40 repeat protein